VLPWSCYQRDDERDVPDFMPALIRKRLTLSFIIGASMAYNTALLLIALRGNSLSPSHGHILGILGGMVLWSHDLRLDGGGMLELQGGRAPLDLVCQGHASDPHTSPFREDRHRQGQVFIAMVIHDHSERQC